jgi:hypothetical protein
LIAEKAELSRAKLELEGDFRNSKLLSANKIQSLKVANEELSKRVIQVESERDAHLKVIQQFDAKRQAMLTIGLSPPSLPFLYNDETEQVSFSSELTSVSGMSISDSLSALGQVGYVEWKGKSECLIAQHLIEGFTFYDYLVWNQYCVSNLFVIVCHCILSVVPTLFKF